MTVVGKGVWDVYVDTRLIPQRAEDWIFTVLYVTSEFVFILGKEFRVAGRREMKDLSNHAGDTVVSALDSQGRGLILISCWSRRISLSVIMSYKVGSCAGAAKDNPFRVYS